MLRGRVATEALLLVACVGTIALCRNAAGESSATDRHPTESYFYNKFRDHMTDSERRLLAAGRLCHNATGTCYFLDKAPDALRNRSEGQVGSASSDVRGAPIAYGFAHQVVDHDNPNGGVYFRCMSGAVHWVGAAQRCDGVDDCDDGTDELHCDIAPEPVWEHRSTYNLNGSSNHRRHFSPLFSESTCIYCRCPHGSELLLSPDAFGKPHPWLKFGLAAEPSNALRTLPPKDIGCHPTQTLSLYIQLYKKNKLCRQAVCCASQTSCEFCTSVALNGFCKCYC